ncbi:hypothetical protein A0H81_11931 [Grifola frondosa]|uniref:BRCT domain-containing protein n=1 Tax=Grifola frondosa TaxID=5627 RepID=A0A1C7LVU7_GRIFR|nr:hypothetical protein A0H81_11931 [Grifola frondosa]
MSTEHGGMVSPGYSGVPYILVDPHKESGQNLYRQYIGKKGKIVLNANWVIECVKAGILQTYHNNGCKVTGNETTRRRPFMKDWSTRFNLMQAAPGTIVSHAQYAFAHGMYPPQWTSRRARYILQLLDPLNHGKRQCHRSSADAYSASSPSSTAGPHDGSSSWLSG